MVSLKLNLIFLPPWREKGEEASTSKKPFLALKPELLHSSVENIASSPIFHPSECNHLIFILYLQVVLSLSACESQRALQPRADVVRSLPQRMGCRKKHDNDDNETSRMP